MIVPHGILVTSGAAQAMERGPVRYPFRIAAERLVTNLRDAHSGRGGGVCGYAVGSRVAPGFVEREQRGTLERGRTGPPGQSPIPMR